MSPLGSDNERAELPEEEVATEDDAQMEAATAASAGPADEVGPELALLDEMAGIANHARYEPDSRVRHLLAWVKAHLCPDLGAPDARWNDRRVLIFTEYTDTKRYLVQQLQAAIAGSDRHSERIMTFHGASAKSAGRPSRPPSMPIRPVIRCVSWWRPMPVARASTFRTTAPIFFHFDVPWNPSRMEQRNGRIDRKLQRSPEVRCHYFVVHQRSEDRVLDVLVRKSEVIHEQLGSLAPVVAKRVDTMLSRGIRHEQVADLRNTLDGIEGAVQRSTEGQVVVEDLEEVRERKATLATQVERLGQMLKESRDWIGLDDRHFRDALSASLEILGAESLKPVDDAQAARDPSTARWFIPHLHERMEADHTWAHTLDALRAPIKKGQEAVGVAQRGTYPAGGVPRPRNPRR